MGCLSEMERTRQRPTGDHEPPDHGPTRCVPESNLKGDSGQTERLRYGWVRLTSAEAHGQGGIRRSDRHRLSVFEETHVGER